MYVAPAPGGARAAWVAGRRVGGAVARNRARRLLREAWRRLAPGVREGHELVLVARPAILEAKMQDLVEEVGDVLWRAGLAGRGEQPSSGPTSPGGSSAGGP